MGIGRPVGIRAILDNPLIMENFLGSVLSFVLLYKYLALFLIAFVGSFGLPLPTATVTVAAAAFAADGFLSWKWVFFITAAASVLGDVAVYWLARYLEQKEFESSFFRHLVPASKRKIFSEQFGSHPFFAIISSRFTNFTTLVINVVSGFVRYSFARFAVFDAIGESASTLLYASLGYVFGSSWMYISQLLEKAGAVFLLVFILLLYKSVKKYLKS